MFFLTTKFCHRCILRARLKVPLVNEKVCHSRSCLRNAIHGQRGSHHGPSGVESCTASQRRELIIMKLHFIKLLQDHAVGEPLPPPTHDMSVLVARLRFRWCWFQIRSTPRVKNWRAENTNEFRIWCSKFFSVSHAQFFFRLIFKIEDRLGTFMLG